MKKIISLSIIISTIFFSALAFGQEEENYKGAWQIKVHHRQKADFEVMKEDVFQEVEKVLEEKGLFTTQRRTIKVKGFDVEIMSQTEFEEGYKWSKVLYTK